MRVAPGRRLVLLLLLPLLAGLLAPLAVPARPAQAATPAFVQTVGSISGTFTNEVVFQTTAPVAAGNSIIVAALIDDTNNPPSFRDCRDAVNGVYSTDVQTVDSVTAGRLVICSRHNSAAVTAGIDITLRWVGDLPTVRIVAMEFSGLKASARDRTAEAVATGSTAQTNPMPATREAHELLVGVVANMDATSFAAGTNGTANTCAPSLTTSYTPGPATAPAAPGLYVQYCAVSTTAAYQSNASFPAGSARYLTVLATYFGPDPAILVNDAALGYIEGDGARAVDSALTIDDPDSANLVGATVRIATNFISAEDSLTFTPNFGITGNFNTGTGALALSGSATKANYETVLRSVSYTNSSQNPSTATRTVEFQPSDGTPGRVTTRDITVSSVNDAPVNGVPGDQTTSEGTPKVFSAATSNAISVMDADAGAADVQMILTVTSGTLSLAPGAPAAPLTSATGSGTASLVLTGTPPEITAALEGLSFTPITDSVADVTLTVVTDDLAHTPAPALTDTDTVTIHVTAVNDPPSGANKTVSTTEDTAYTFSTADFVLTDPNDTPPNTLAGVKIASLPTAGSLTNNNAPVNVNDVIPLVNITGGLFKFVPAANANGVGAASFTFQVQDNGGTANGGVDLDPTARTMTIDVTAVNDPPTVTTTAGTATYTENGVPVVIDPGLTIVDVDSTNLTGAAVFMSGNFQVGEDVMACPACTGLGINAFFGSNGLLNLAGTVPVASYEAAIRSATYANTSESPTTATRTVTFFVIDDTGRQSNAPTRDITIAVVNDPPVNTVPGAQTTPGNTPKVFSTADGNAISIADVDAGSGALQVTIVVSTGTVALGSTAGLTVNGNGTGTVTATGTLADLNAGLQGLRVTPLANLGGSIILTITTNDQGNTGGPALQDQDDVVINLGLLPTVSINDPAAVIEGNSGSANSITFTVTLSAPSNLQVTVPYTIAGPTATGGAACGSGVDFVPPAGPVVFAPSVTSQPIAVPICGDLVAEGNETFLITLGTPTNATLADPQGVGTITDDDGTPTLTISDATVAEGDAGTATLTFTVTLTPASSQPVTVPFSTAGQTATGGAACTANVDYLTPTGSPLAFQPTETSKTLTVTVCADTLSEGTETLALNLGTPTGGATVADGQGVGTITDDDVAGAVSFSAATAQVAENAGSVTLTVQRGDGGATSTGIAGREPPERQRPPGRLSGPATGTGAVSPNAISAVTVNYATANGSAVAGLDYTTTTGTLTFGVGETSKIITVPILPDAVDERPETFTVTLSAPAGGATLGAITTATVTIADVDTTPCQTTLSAPIPAGTTVLPVISQAGCNVGDVVAIDPGQPNEDRGQIIGFGSIIIQQQTAHTHAAGAVVIRVTGGLPPGAVQPGPGTGVTDTPPTAQIGPGDDDTDRPRKNGENERRNRTHPNQAGKDDESIEGDVLETRCDQPWPSVVIADRDGEVEVRLIKEAQNACSSIQVGDYLEADGEKQHEQLFDADSVEIKHRR